MKRYLIAELCAVAVLSTACSSSTSGAPPSSSTASSPAASSSSPTTFDLIGTLTLYGPISTGTDAMTVGATCIGIENPSLPSENFEDIGAGTQITIKDGTGATVGLGTLSTSELQIVNPLESRACSFQMSVTGIEAGKGFYSMLIGNHGTQQTAEADFIGDTELSLKSELYSA